MLMVPKGEVGLGFNMDHEGFAQGWLPWVGLFIGNLNDARKWTQVFIFNVINALTTYAKYKPCMK